MTDCRSCGATFDVEHEEDNDPEYCPFCGEELAEEAPLQIETTEDEE